MTPSHTTKACLIDLARKVCESRAGRQATEDAGRQIAENIASFFSIFAKWPAMDAGNPVSTGNEGVRHGR
jgi:hypothetical protein